MGSIGKFGAEILGEKSLFKIIGQIGNPIRVDFHTKEMNRLSYPRVLIEVLLDQDLEEKICFEDEYGYVNEVKVIYEWKPSVCKHCRGIGHLTEECRKKLPQKQQWVMKTVKKDNVPEVDQDGFQKVIKKGAIQKQKTSSAVEVTNPFQMLSEEKLSNDNCLGQNSGDQVDIDGNNEVGGEPTLGNG